MIENLYREMIIWKLIKQNTITHCIRNEYNDGDKGMLVTQVKLIKLLIHWFIDDNIIFL